VRTVEVDKTNGPETVSDTSSYDIPKGLSLWETKGGSALKIPAD